MARGGKNTKTAANKAEAETEKETPMSESTTESTTENTTAPEATEAPVDTFDLTDFKAATNAAVEAADESTGLVPEAEVAKANAAFAAIDSVKGRNAAKSWVDDQIVAQLEELKAVTALAYQTVRKSLTVAKGRTPAAPVDPTDAYVDRLAALILAQTIVVNTKPEAVDQSANLKANEKANELSVQAKEYLDWQNADESTRGDEPQVDAVVKAAYKASRGKGMGGGNRGPRSGARKNVAAHIESAFADVEPGTFLTVAQIMNHKSEEYGENDAPSAGAITQRLFPPSGKPTTVKGVEPVDADGDTPKGARKI